MIIETEVLADSATISMTNRWGHREQRLPTRNKPPQNVITATRVTATALGTRQSPRKRKNTCQRSQPCQLPMVPRQYKRARRSVVRSTATIEKGPNSIATAISIIDSLVNQQDVIKAHVIGMHVCIPTWRTIWENITIKLRFRTSCTCVSLLREWLRASNDWLDI